MTFCMANSGSKTSFSSDIMPRATAQTVVISAKKAKAFMPGNSSSSTNISGSKKPTIAETAMSAPEKNWTVRAADSVFFFGN